jgi:hypothetical protein
MNSDIKPIAITNLDKHLVIQTLFAHADALAMGQHEYDFRKKVGR